MKKDPQNSSIYTLLPSIQFLLIMELTISQLYMCKLHTLSKIGPHQLSSLPHQDGRRQQC